MKISKKLTVVLLALVIVAGLFSGCVQTADSNWKLDPVHYTDLDEYNIDKNIVHRRDMGNGTSAEYYFVQENSTYELYINTDRLDIALIHKGTKEAWYSNPTQSVIDESGKSDELKS